jgi:hypothetical protein
LLRIIIFDKHLRRCRSVGKGETHAPHNHLSLLYSHSDCCVYFNRTSRRAAEARPVYPEERAKAVALAHQLEDQPLGPGAADARKWLTIWLIEIPDISVEFCPSALGPDLVIKKNNATEISA